MVSIAYDDTRTVVGEEDRTVYFTLTDDNATEYQWWVDIPRDGDIQPYLDSMISRLLLYIRKREYPEARGVSSLAEMDQWIVDNPDIVPLPWEARHPEIREYLDINQIDPRVWTSLDNVKGTDPNLDTVISAFENIFNRI